MPPQILVNNCKHQGFLIPTVFRDTSIPNPEHVEGDDKPKVICITVTVQAFCISCRQNIKLGMPGEPT